MMPKILSSINDGVQNSSNNKDDKKQEAATTTITRNLHQQNDHQHHLVIHFDINETILVGDEAGGDTREDCLNKIIAKSAFVQMPQQQDDISNSIHNDDENDKCNDILKEKEHSDVLAAACHDNKSATKKEERNDKQLFESTSSMVPTHWWDGTPIKSSTNTTSITKGNAEKVLVQPPPPPLYTGWDWPPNCCPYYRTSFKSKAKQFTQQDGIMYRQLYEEMERQLLVPFFGNSTTTTSSSKCDATTTAAEYELSHMLPALFETLVALSQKSHASTSSSSSTSPFTIVFRTFGNDLPTIADAMTLFATGKHPNYPKFQNSKLALSTKDLYIGRWRRRSSCTRTNTSNNNKKRKKEDNAVSTELDVNKPKDEGEYVYELFSYDNKDQEPTLVASGDEAILDFLHDQTICGIQDDYPFWKEHNYEPWAGKPVWVPAQQQQEEQVSVIREQGSGGDGIVVGRGRRDHHILFDDNIHNLVNDSIASIRYQDVLGGNFRTLSGLEILKLQGLHLVRVPTIEPILHTDWFLKQIEKVETKLIAKLQ